MMERKNELLKYCNTCAAIWTYLHDHAHVFLNKQKMHKKHACDHANKCKLLHMHLQTQEFPIVCHSHNTKLIVCYIAHSIHVMLASTVPNLEFDISHCRAPWNLVSSYI